MGQLHYARRLLVHIKDMIFLHSRNADMFEVFMKGHFVEHTIFFSIIAMNQVHEQENIKIKKAIYIFGSQKIPVHCIVGWQLDRK